MNRWILTKRLGIERLEPVLRIEGVWPILGVGDYDITKNMTLLGKKGLWPN